MTFSWFHKIHVKTNSVAKVQLLQYVCVFKLIFSNKELVLSCGAHVHAFSPTCTLNCINMYEKMSKIMGRNYNITWQERDNLNYLKILKVIGARQITALFGNNKSPKSCVSICIGDCYWSEYRLWCLSPPKFSF